MTIEVAGCRGLTWLKPLLNSASITDSLQHIHHLSPPRCHHWSCVREQDESLRLCSSSLLSKGSLHFSSPSLRQDNAARRSGEFSCCGKHENRNIIDTEDNLWSQKSRDLLSTSAEYPVKRNRSLKGSKKALSFTGPFDFITCLSIKCSFQNMWDLKYYGHTTLHWENDLLPFFLFFFLFSKVSRISGAKSIAFLKSLSTLILRTEILQGKSLCLYWFFYVFATASFSLKLILGIKNIKCQPAVFSGL